jgi:hypothetical protein
MKFIQIMGKAHIDGTWMNVTKCFLFWYKINTKFGKHAITSPQMNTDFVSDPIRLEAIEN